MDKEQFKDALCETIEEVAREEAERTGFDIATEAGGLFRALLIVISSKSLFNKAITRAKTKCGLS